jgi:nucleotidyltransferase substrate binding protein (TIGR01987 family)
MNIMNENNKDIRWRQRFENFKKSFLQLKISLDILKPSKTEKAGQIQLFEVTFELGWKTLKDYLEAGGFIVKTPRDVIKKAFEIEMIADGEVWLRALEDRNKTSHIYDENEVEKITKKIKMDYFPAIFELQKLLTKEL